MDNRLAILEEERNMFKGKYRSLLKLVSKTRDHIIMITDYIEDEGDRKYFGSTNDADELCDLKDHMDAWVWDAVDKVNRMQKDPYAEIRAQRSRAEAAETVVSSQKTIINEALGWVRHWRLDVATDLKPTPDSLAMVEAKLVAALDADATRERAVA